VQRPQELRLAAQRLGALQGQHADERAGGEAVVELRRGRGQAEGAVGLLGLPMGCLHQPQGLAQGALGHEERRHPHGQHLHAHAAGGQLRQVPPRDHRPLATAPALDDVQQQVGVEVDDRRGQRSSPDPGSAIFRCAIALTRSGMTSFIQPCTLMRSGPATTCASPSISAS
jgi:hypothetical protein